MEYFLGSLLTLIIMSYFGKRSAKLLSEPIKKIIYSQSYIDNLISQKMLEEFLPKSKNKTQSSEHNKGTEVRVLVVEGEAYWIAEQTLYVAQVIDGIINDYTAKKVDTMAMNTVQLEKTQFIVKKLTEGKGNDSGYPRKS